MLWGDLDHSRALWILHCPRYAGAFCFGRSRQRRLPDGRHTNHKRLPVEEWTALIHDAHKGYVTWDEYEQNLQILSSNMNSPGAGRENGAPREGPALLQGLAICAKCGNRMTIRYHTRCGGRVPSYVCQQHGIEHAQPICQLIVGSDLDAAIGTLLVQLVTPLTLEIALAVQTELENRSEDGDRMRRQEIERARYETDLARRRYMRVDPDNRLVADSLEAEWNHALRAQAAAQERYDKQRQIDQAKLDQQQRASILALAKDFPRLWKSPATPDRERKRMARLLIADVTLLKETEIVAQVRFNGGATHTLRLPPAQPAWQSWQTSPALVAEIDRLLEQNTDSEIARTLNAGGLKSGKGQPFSANIVHNIRTSYGLKSRFDRLRARGLLTLDEMATRLGVCRDTVKAWRNSGLLKAHPFDDRRECLYETPNADASKKFQHHRKRAAVLADSTQTSLSTDQ